MVEQHKRIVKLEQRLRFSKTMNKEVASLEQIDSAEAPEKLPEKKPKSRKPRFLDWKEFEDPSRLREINVKFYQVEDLRDKIQSILQKKLKYDEACRREGGQRKSMAQFLFQFFRNEAERQTQVVEEVFNFIASLNVHRADPDTAMFTLILRNEIEEEFAEVHFQIKCRVEDLLRLQIKKENPDISGKSLTEKVEQAKQGKIRRATALRIVEKMYGDDHPSREGIARKLGGSLPKSNRLKKFSTYNPRRKIARSRSRKEKKATSRSESQFEDEEAMVTYSELERIVLMTEIKTHREFLKFVCFEFRKLDPSNFGFLSKAKFKSFLVGLFRKEKTDSDVKKLLKKREGFDPRSITFSDVIILLTNKTVNNGSEIVTVLQNLYDKFYS